MEKEEPIIIKMKYIKNWACKQFYSFQSLLKNIKVVLKTSFAIAGVVLTLAEFADEVFDYQKLFELLKNHFLIFLIISLFVSAIKNWDNLKYSFDIAGSSDVTITLKVGDALRNRGAVIIPTNTTFDTLMEGDFISEGSLQGQFQKKFFKKDSTHFKELNKLIRDGLDGKDFKTLSDGRKTKNNRYPIGTVCKISLKNKRAYYLADSDINKNGICEDANYASITEALDGLWGELIKNGNKEPYSIPLLGTGKAGAKDASRDDVIKQIVLSFLSATKEHKITENLIICVHAADYKKVHWTEILEFIKYQCQFANIKPTKNDKLGKAERVPDNVSLQNDNNAKSQNTQPILKPTELSELDKQLIALLQNENKSITEIASDLKMPIQIVKKRVNYLVENGYIHIKGTRKNRSYTFISDE